MAERALRIQVDAVSTAAPDEVIAVLGSDFSPRRAKTWLNVTTRRLELHERGDTFAEVTEGSAFVRPFWERCRYEWSRPGSVTAVVVDSNILQTGSTWELQATPRASGGSAVRMIIDRRYVGGARGFVAYTLNRLGGERGFAWALRKALAAVD
jgi:hypothetical protein